MLGIVEVAMNLNASNIVVGGDRRVFVTPLTYRPSDRQVRAIVLHNANPPF